VFLFPGQASPVRLGAGIQGRRYPQVAALYRTAALPRNGDIRATETAQLAIVTAELAGIRLLNAIGVEASAALGHSLGELTAYYWAQALDESSLLGLVRARGRLMSEIPARQGAMASISASAAEVESLLEKGEPIVVACFNAPRQVVVSGESNTVTRVVLRAQVSGRSAILLSTSHAFHSPLMSASAENFREVVASFPFGSLRRPVISTITGRELSEACDLRRLLVEQLSRPVRFLDALIEAEQGTDLFVEVGPGLILTHLLQDISKKPVVSLDVAGDSLAGVLQAAASAYVLGAPLKHDALFDCRFARPFDLDWHPRFFANPCELAPPSPVVIEDAQPTVPSEPQPSRGTESSSAAELTMVSNDAPLHVVQELVARRTELPASAVSASSRFLRDLHLNSMVVGEIVAATARRLGVPPPGHLLQFADATVSELAHALEQIRANHGSMTPEHETIPVGVDEWVRPFLVDWLPRPLQPRTSPAEPFGTWQAFGPPDHPLLESLSPISLPGNGTIVCLSEAPLEEQVAFLLSGAQAVLRAAGRDRYFVVTAPFSAAGSFARTLGLENPDILTRVIEADIGPDLIAHMRAELSDIPRHVEARYDSGGQRYEAGFKLLGNTQEDGIPLRPGDLVLVSGGGKGIAAECAMLLAQESGARLVLLGRSRTEDDPVLAAHLRKIEASGVQAKYIRSDVANPQSVSAAVSVVEQMYGPVVGIIHGAGHNEPRMVKDLDELALRRTLAPKVQGFRNLVAAVDPERLRLLVTFGSVIGRVGLWGEADYALANSYLSSLVERFARAHTHCHCLAFESSAWAGIGMAERLGKVEALRSAGITAIKPATGVSWFRNLVARRLTAVTVVLTGRLGASSPIPLEGSPLPLLRFLERPRVHYPGVELIVEAELTLASDAYLLDHVFQGQPLLPAVVGLEAMVQAAQALVSDERIPVLEGVRFDRPVVVEGGARVTVRIAALVQDTGRVDVALRSSQTSFQVDHFRCSCVFTDTPSRSEHMIPIPDQALLPVHPERDLYGRILFQGPRFQRLKGYRRLSARFSSAEIATASPQSWFSEYLPNSLILGDPAARDAALHSIQACVPQATLLPISVDRILPSALNSDEPLMAHAREQWQGGDTYCYDLELRTKDGILRESWEGLRLRKVADAGKDGWPDALVAAFLEWQVRESTPTARVFAALERDVKIDRQQRSQRAIRRALDAPCSVRWRHDGKPEVDPPFVVSSAHADPLTLAVAGVQVVACDLERIRARPEEVWHDLLGDERFLLARVIADQSKEDFHTAATRIWTATEALAKAEASPDAPLVLLLPPFDHGGISLTSPGFTIVTTVIRSHDEPAPIAVAILSRSEK
jgi:enediyne polyketide synthase